MLTFFACRCQAAGASLGELRRDITAALNSTFPATAGDRRTQAKRFLALYAAAAELPPAERTRLQTRLKSRLARLASGIRQDVREKMREQKSPTASASTSAHQPPGAESQKTRRLAGGAAQDEGQALVDLIEATIAPESWDVNGGPGTIKYWPAWHVLVVRQTDEVHEQLGGVVHGMRQ